MTLWEQFEKETNNKWYIEKTDGVHVVAIRTPNIEYVEWLEAKITSGQGEMMNENDKKILDEWWNTEPFGFDNPDTYAGIISVIDKILVNRSEHAENSHKEK